MWVHFRLMLAAMLLSQSTGLGGDSRAPTGSPPSNRFSGRTFQFADEGPESLTGLLVLDNRDDGLTAESLGDTLSLIDDAGAVQWRTTGFGICETIGGVHRLAIDVQRRRIYVAENLANRVTALDFAGRRRMEIDGINASAIAVDEQWGHVWVSFGDSINAGETLIFDPEGTVLNSLPFRGVDLVNVKDSGTGSFWMSGTHTRQVNSAGKILLERQHAAWCEPTLATTGDNVIWVGERSHPDVKKSADRVRRLRSGEVDLTVELPEHDPFVIVPDQSEGLWVGGYQGLRHISSRGELGPVIDLKVMALERVRRGEGLYVASQDEIVKISDRGEILSRLQWPRATTLLAR